MSSNQGLFNKISISMLKQIIGAQYFLVGRQGFIKSNIHDPFRQGVFFPMPRPTSIIPKEYLFISTQSTEIVLKDGTRQTLFDLPLYVNHKYLDRDGTFVHIGHAYGSSLICRYFPNPINWASSLQKGIVRSEHIACLPVYQANMNNCDADYSAGWLFMIGMAYQNTKPSQVHMVVTDVDSYFKTELEEYARSRITKSHKYMYALHPKYQRSFQVPPFGPKEMTDELDGLKNKQTRIIVRSAGLFVFILMTVKSEELTHCQSNLIILYKWQTSNKDLIHLDTKVENPGENSQGKVLSKFEARAVESAKWGPLLLVMPAGFERRLRMYSIVRNKMVCIQSLSESSPLFRNLCRSMDDKVNITLEYIGDRVYIVGSREGAREGGVMVRYVEIVIR